MRIKNISSTMTFCTEWFQSFGHGNDQAVTKMRERLDVLNEKQRELDTELHTMRENYKILTDTSRNIQFGPGETRQTQIAALKTAMMHKLTDSQFNKKKINMHTMAIRGFENRARMSDLRGEIDIINNTMKEHSIDTIDPDAFAEEYDKMTESIAEMADNSDTTAFVWMSDIEGDSASSLAAQGMLSAFLGESSESYVDALPSAPISAPRATENFTRVPHI